MSGSPEQLARLMGQMTIGKEGDVEKYEQLKLSHSQVITSFSSRSACWGCFKNEHNLSNDAIKAMYTQDDFYQNLNIALCQGDITPQFKMYTQLLAHTVWSKIEVLPDKVYRGVNFSDRLVDMYEAQKGNVIYWYGFTSTTRDEKITKEFGDWRIEIELVRGCRDCVADISSESKYPQEKEILISANAGFKVIDVNKKEKVIYLRLVDEAHCLKWEPNKSCNKHKVASIR
mmetsp:Transcript_20033/g.47998  ORF Transcript_20033/g.47998 Transcript_20033/m.47998 type:complete len:230 (+) Transcript_20033:55-744(+)